jgi:hypothetical protein
MKQLIRLEKSIKNHAIARIRNYKKNAMPDHVITSHLVQANNSQDFWFQYFVNFYDSSTSIEMALLKARTFAVAIRCQWLMERRGCSLKRIFEILNREIAYRRIALDHEMIPVADFSFFAESIESFSWPEKDEE